MKNKVLIFGGSFSPPTLAHEAIIKQCLLLPNFDQVWVMPSADRPDKTMAMTIQDRLQMLELIKAKNFSGDPRLHVSDFELNLSRPTQTYRTVKELEKAYPATEFCFVFGMDAYKDMPKWPHGEELRKMLRMVIFDSSKKAASLGDNVINLKLNGELGDISSTQVRQALAAGQSLEGLVSKPVANYLTRASNSLASLRKPGKSS